jgi:phosphoglycerate dehydrogenase-like enzyme
VTSETRGLIDAAALQAMRADAYLINVGRGESVVEDALIAALRNHRIAGAALDVFAQEPLPPDHPFWSLPNLVLTPHISGHTRGYLRKAIAIFEVNLERFLSGRPLRNVVDKRLGYARADEAR